MLSVWQAIANAKPKGLLTSGSLGEVNWSQSKHESSAQAKENGSDVVPWVVCLIYGRGEISLDLPDIHAHLEN